MLTRSRLVGWIIALGACSATCGERAVGTDGTTGSATATKQQVERGVRPAGQQRAGMARRAIRARRTTRPRKAAEAGVLVQSSGDTWRQIRNGPITVYGGWLVVLVALAIAAFYVARGPIKTARQADRQPDLPLQRDRALGALDDGDQLLPAGGDRPHHCCSASTCCCR